MFSAIFISLLLNQAAASGINTKQEIDKEPTSEAAVASDNTPSPPAATEKRVCKRQKQTGSLVGNKKICRTKSEWDKTEAQARQDVGEMQRTTQAPRGN